MLQPPRMSRWSAGVRLVAYGATLVVILGAIGFAFVIILAAAIGIFAALGLVAVFLAITGYIGWEYSPPPAAPPR